MSDTLNKIFYKKTNDEITKSMETIDPDSLLWLSIKNNFFEGVKRAIKRGANVNSDEGKCLKTALIKNDYESFTLLVNNGGDIQIDDNFLIRKACEFGNIEIVELLIDKGADVNAGSGSPIINSCIREYYNILELLVNNGADVNVLEQPISNNPIFGLSPLFIVSADSQNEKYTKYLLERGANLAYNNYETLRQVYYNDNIYIMKILLQYIPKNVNIFDILDENNAMSKKMLDILKKHNTDNI